VLTFLGFDLQLSVDGLFGGPDPRVRSAEDPSGGRWLIVQVDEDPDHLVWVCAPISRRALEAVVSGRASAGDAVRHSETGIVEVVTVDHGRAVPDRCLCCASIPDDFVRARRESVLAGG
jgi:hypothetical protein